MYIPFFTVDQKAIAGGGGNHKQWKRNDALSSRPLITSITTTDTKNFYSNMKKYKSAKGYVLLRLKTSNKRSDCWKVEALPAILRNNNSFL